MPATVEELTALVETLQSELVLKEKDRNESAIQCLKICTERDTLLHLLEKLYASKSA